MSKQTHSVYGNSAYAIRQDGHGHWTAHKRHPTSCWKLGPVLGKGSSPFKAAADAEANLNSDVWVRIDWAGAWPQIGNDMCKAWSVPNVLDELAKAGLTVTGLTYIKEGE